MRAFDLCSIGFGPWRQEYTPRDVMLYALSIGMASDPIDDQELPFVFERDLVAFPTYAAVLASPGFWQQDPRLGLKAHMCVLAQQELEIIRPLQPAGDVTSAQRIEAVVDKGVERGAILMARRELRDSNSGELLSVLRSSTMARGDGGCGNCGEAYPAMRVLPTRSPDAEYDIQTLPQAGLLYRLNGDLNPLHADPGAARQAGFARPILHGLCTFALATRAVLKGLQRSDASSLRRVAAKFVSPVFPGQTINTKIWREAGELFIFRSSVEDDATTVLVGEVQLGAC